MDVTVVIPVYKTGDMLFKLFRSLENQSYNKFSVMIVYKEWDGYTKVLERIKDFGGLDIDVVKQDEGRFEEALNTVYRKADGDIVIHTDDDAFVSDNWVRDHIELHHKYERVGMATGVVDESTLPDGRPVPPLTKFINRYKWRMNKHTLIDAPIDKKFIGYGMYIGVSGMLVDTGKRFNMIKTFRQHGVNMSWKQDALHGFRLPGYTKQGGRNEAAAALEVINRGFDAVWFDKGLVHHPLQRSDSRDPSVIYLPEELTAESVVFSYYVNKFYAVNLTALRIRAMISDIATRMVTLNKNCGYGIGYDITKRAIDNDWKPAMVRAGLISALDEASR